MTEEKKVFRPYLVDGLTVKVQTLDTVSTNQGEKKTLQTTHDFNRLNSSNFALLLQREKEIKREKEEIGKERTRGHYDETLADGNLYDAIIRGGELREFKSEEVIKTYSREDMLRLEREKKRNAVVKSLECKVRVLIAEDDYEFMFEQEGLLTVELSIGDRDEPDYRFLLGYRRPDPNTRSRFTEGFAYQTEKRGGDLTLVQTVIDIRKGVTNFDEHFTSIIPDGEMSDVVFRNPEWNEDSPEDVSPVVSYTDEMRAKFLQEINPHFKIEVAATVSRFFNKSDSD